jgi:hypothetical protein
MTSSVTRQKKTGSWFSRVSLACGPLGVLIALGGGAYAECHAPTPPPIVREALGLTRAINDLDALLRRLGKDAPADLQQENLTLTARVNSLLARPEYERATQRYETAKRRSEEVEQRCTTVGIGMLMVAIAGRGRPRRFEANYVRKYG